MQAAAYNGAHTVDFINKINVPIDLFFVFVNCQVLPKSFGFIYPNDTIYQILYSQITNSITHLTLVHPKNCPDF